jgi:hypothetical protein
MAMVGTNLKLADVQKLMRERDWTGGELEGDSNYADGLTTWIVRYHRWDSPRRADHEQWVKFYPSDDDPAEGEVCIFAQGGPSGEKDFEIESLDELAQSLSQATTDDLTLH